MLSAVENTLTAKYKRFSMVTIRQRLYYISMEFRYSEYISAKASQKSNSKDSVLTTNKKSIFFLYLSSSKTALSQFVKSNLCF